MIVMKDDGVFFWVYNCITIIDEEWINGILCGSPNAIIPQITGGDDFTTGNAREDNQNVGFTTSQTGFDQQTIDFKWYSDILWF